jgi:hypothetical protein
MKSSHTLLLSSPLQLRALFFSLGLIHVEGSEESIAHPVRGESRGPAPMNSPVGGEFIGAGSPSFRILVAKSIFTLRMNAFKMKKSIVFDFAARIKCWDEPVFP